MADWKSKDDLQDAIQTARLEFEDLLEAIPEEEMVAPLMENGWSVKDTVMHILSWEQRLIGWLNTAAEGDEPQLPAPGYTWDQMDELNHQSFVQQQHRSLEDVLASFHASLNLLYFVLDRFDDEALNAPYLKDNNEALWQSFADNTYEHYEEHAAEIRAARVP